MILSEHKSMFKYKLDSTVDRILLLWGPFISEESNMIKQVHLFTDHDGIVQYSILNFISDQN